MKEEICKRTFLSKNKIDQSSIVTKVTVYEDNSVSGYLCINDGYGNSITLSSGIGIDDESKAKKVFLDKLHTLALQIEEFHSTYENREMYAPEKKGK